MRTIKKAKRMQSVAEALKRDGRTIAFVPTMGALHEGHLSLVRRAGRLCDVVVVSIYVNPSQFGPGEDYQTYPRALDRDKKLLKELDVDYLFLPDDTEMYPCGFMTHVETEGVTSILEGESRPDHFRGVTTVVAKLFNIVRPDVAVFGQKDAQQAVVIRRMVADLNVPVKVVVAPTVREESGLAMSSRNRYLSAEQMERASCLYSGLRKGWELIRSGVRDSKTAITAVEDEIDGVRGAEIDYVSVNDVDTLEEVADITKEVLLLGAVKLDGVRLIDNIRVKPVRGRGLERGD